MPTEIDFYRDRVGSLVRDDHLLAYLRVAVTDVAGPAEHWWRRSGAAVAPTVAVHVRFLDDDDLHSRTLTSAELESHLGRWARHQHVVYGDVYQLRWLDDADARRLTGHLFVAT